MILTTICVSYPLAVYILQNDQDTTEKKQSSGIQIFLFSFTNGVPSNPVSRPPIYHLWLLVITKSGKKKEK